MLTHHLVKCKLSSVTKNTKTKTQWHQKTQTKKDKSSPKKKKRGSLILPNWVMFAVEISLFVMEILTSDDFHNNYSVWENVARLKG